MKKTHLAIAVASLLSHISFSQAQENSSDIETLVITANRFEQDIKDTIAQLDVITKAEIAEMQAASLDEVLQRVSGIQVISNGYGKTPEVYIRGTSSRHQLVLINGIKIGSATLGSTDISKIPVTGIERIEIIKGSRAALYGTDAIGGVINIITKGGSSNTYNEIGGGVGTNGYRRGTLTVSGDFGNSAWSRVSVTTEENDGFSSLPEPYEQDEDGFSSTNLILELGSMVSEGLEASLQGYYNNGESEYDSGGLQAPAYTSWENDPDRYAEFENYNISGKLRLLRDSYSSELVVAQNQDNSANKDDSGYNSLFETDRTVINWLNHIEVRDDLSLGGGVEWQQEKVSTNGDSYIKDDRSNNALYVTSIYQPGYWLFEASVRSDDSDVYGRNTTWQLGVESQHISLFNWSLNAGTAFKAPTFNDLYYPEDSYGYVGNPDVQAEESSYLEVTLFGSTNLFDWKITSYRTEIDNLIDWEYDYTSFTGTPVNRDSATIKGLEVQFEFETGLLNHTFSYDYIDTRDDETGNELQRRSMHAGLWNVNYVLESWSLDLSARYKGSSYNDSDNTQQLKAYTVVDGAVSYNVTSNLVVRGRIVNLLDHDYVSKLDYNGYAYNNAGREYYLNVNYSF